jgi:hypothetical protein
MNIGTTAGGVKEDEQADNRRPSDRSDAASAHLISMGALKRGQQRTRLYIMLGLNMGAYAADIGRLTLPEVILDNAYSPSFHPIRASDIWPELLTAR